MTATNVFTGGSAGPYNGTNGVLSVGDYGGSTLIATFTADTTVGALTAGAISIELVALDPDASFVY
jgi:hypothetical protein